VALLPAPAGIDRNAACALLRQADIWRTCASGGCSCEAHSGCCCHGWHPAPEAGRAPGARASGQEWDDSESRPGRHGAWRAWQIGKRTPRAKATAAPMFLHEGQRDARTEHVGRLGRLLALWWCTLAQGRLLRRTNSSCTCGLVVAPHGGTPPAPQGDARQLTQWRSALIVVR